MNQMARIDRSQAYPAPTGFAAARRRSTLAAFRAARRHSRMVRLLRILVPAASVIGVAVAGFVIWFEPMRLLQAMPLSLKDVVISGTKITMEQPRLSGFTRDVRPYELYARVAAQDITKPKLVELSDLRAKFQMHDKTTVDMTAASGLFDSKAEQLTLERDIVVKSSTGYEGRLNQAVINTRTGDIVSNKPVVLDMVSTTVKADGMTISQSGDLIRFAGRVAVTLIPNKRPQADGKATDGKSKGEGQ